MDLLTRVMQLEIRVRLMEEFVGLTDFKLITAEMAECEKRRVRALTEFVGLTLQETEDKQSNNYQDDDEDRYYFLIACECLESIKQVKYFVSGEKATHIWTDSLASAKWFYSRESAEYICEQLQTLVDYTKPHVIE
jgi:hypothetical protein